MVRCLGVGGEIAESFLGPDGVDVSIGDKGFAGIVRCITGGLIGDAALLGGGGLGGRGRGCEMAEGLDWIASGSTYVYSGSLSIILSNDLARSIFLLAYGLGGWTAVDRLAWSVYTYYCI